MGILYLLNFCVAESKDITEMAKEVRTMCEEMIDEFTSGVDVPFKLYQLAVELLYR